MTTTDQSLYPVPCDCEYHRMMNAWAHENPGRRRATESALHMAYWSTHCARCGAGVEFTAWTGETLCDTCEVEVSRDND